jgi:hypothetical protein
VIRAYMENETGKAAGQLLSTVGAYLYDDQIAQLISLCRDGSQAEVWAAFAHAAGPEQNRLGIVLQHAFKDVSPRDRAAYLTVLAFIGYDKVKGKPSEADIKAVIDRLRTLGLDFTVGAEKDIFAQMAGETTIEKIADGLEKGISYAGKAWKILRPYTPYIAGAAGLVLGPGGAAAGYAGARLLLTE